MATRTVLITGDAAVNRKLARLRTTEAKKVLRKAARPAMKPVLNQIRSAARAFKRTGQLAKSIKLRALPRSRKRFGVRIIAKTKYAAPQEWGWRIGTKGSGRRGRIYDRRTGRVRRKIEGKFFMKHAADKQRPAALRIYNRKIAQGIEEAFGRS